jgi:integrase
MARLMNRLSARFVDKAVTPGLFADGAGLYLRVAPGGSKQWIFRYQRGKQHDLGLGPTHAVPLADARRKAFELRRQLFDGIDPARERRRAHQRPVEEITFAECAKQFITSHQAAWKAGGKSAHQWTASLTAEVFPVIGKLPVKEIETGDVMRVLDRIWTEKPVTASLIRARIEAVLGWATTRGYRTGDNPARWRDHLENLLPSPKKVRNVVPAIPLDMVPAFLTALRGRKGMSYRAIELVLFTAVRSGEALGARWGEVDLRDRLWTVSGQRTKTGAELTVPLSDAAVETLTGLAELGQGEFVFPGTKSDRPLSPNAMQASLANLDFGNSTIHGLRATFRTWAAERTNFAPELAEAALGHKVGTQVERAYRRGSFLQRRRALMDAWANFCTAPTAEIGGEVIAIGDRR